MKKLLFVLALLAAGEPARAGAIVGATEFTQIANNVELMMQYSTQIQQYSTQLQQYQAQLQNLVQNPTSMLGGETTQLINGIGGIMQAGKSIGGTLTQIDGNFAQTFKSPLARTFSDSFKAWTATSVDTLEAALKSAGMHRDQFSTDTAALTALFNRSQSSTGTVAAVQQLAALNAMQIQQTQKLGDLISSQNLAASTWMAAQVRKEQAQADVTTRVMKFTVPPAPTASDHKNEF
jgi:P-type conjugative transfer protein TrbJ